jgi:hypothetical protein
MRSHRLHPGKVDWHLTNLSARVPGLIEQRSPMANIRADSLHIYDWLLSRAWILFSLNDPFSSASST